MQTCKACGNSACPVVNKRRPLWFECPATAYEAAPEWDGDPEDAPEVDLSDAAMLRKMRAAGVI